MMIDNVELTRQGWIKHLATLQDMIRNVEVIHTNLEMAFQSAECEKDRSEKISKTLVKLQELIWESGAISEKIHRERGTNDEEFDAFPRDMTDAKMEYRRGKLHRAAKDLEAISRCLWDEGAPEVVTADAVYPGPMAEEVKPEEDRNQMKLPLKPAEPPVVDATKLLDYKMQQANDDTATPSEDEGSEE